MGADTSVVKKKHEWNPMGGEEEWMEKHQDMEGKGKKWWTPTRAETQDTIANPYSLGTHLVKAHWTPTGCGPKDLLSSYIFTMVKSRTEIQLRDCYIDYNWCFSQIFWSGFYGFCFLSLTARHLMMGGDLWC